MLPQQRYKKILELVKIHGLVKTSELMKVFNVSVDTIRRDLEYLEKQKLLARVHGGATLRGDQVKVEDFASREVKLLEEKQELADTALQFIQEGQAIAMNAGTTNIELAKKMVPRFNQLTIITNALKLVQIFSVKRNYTIIVPGGVLNPDEQSLYGRKTEKDIGQYNISLSFISINAISLEKGLTDFRLDEVGIINAIVEHAQKNIIVADSSKFETISYINVCDFSRIDRIVTDSKVSPAVVEKYRQAKVPIISSLHKEAE